jgi:transposase-like protein
MRHAAQSQKRSLPASAKRAARYSSAAVAQATTPDAQADCEIVSVGKRRNGSPRFWCLRHRVDATEKYGRPAKACRNAGQRPLDPKDILTLDLDEYAGGIALWGASPPIYDTTVLPLERGIHVHARPEADSEKEIDASFAAVRIVGSAVPEGGILISEADAVHFMTSSVFGVAMSHIVCAHCGHPHLDADWFSTHAHSRHLCGACGRYFKDLRASVGNPICGVREACGVKAPRLKNAPEKLAIRQSDYPGGIQIWGSSPALLWTSRTAESRGIHVHAFKANGELPVIDETYSAVTIDGVKLDPQMVRVLMAQRTLLSLRNRVTAIHCPDCSAPLFEDGILAFTPQLTHTCAQCGSSFTAKGRYRMAIGNPLPGILPPLAKGAPRAPQHHELTLTS